MEETRVVAEMIVCPSPEELSVITNSICCEHCGLVFQNEPRYRMHDLKVHQRKKLSKTTKENVRYHCPIRTCIYAPESQRFFATMKYLKQHYLKVHAEKTFACSRCDKSFSTEAAKEGHMRVCGVEFTCVCSKIYNSYEALLTHAKRSLHVLDEKYKHSLRRANSKTIARTMRSSTSALSGVNKPITILPSHNELGGSNYNIDVSRKITVNVGVQTDECKRNKRTFSPSKHNNSSYNNMKRRVSKQTQTQTNIMQETKHKDNEITETKVVEVENMKVKKCKKIHSLPKKIEVSLLKEDINLEENFTSTNLFSPSPLHLQHDVELQDFWEEKNNSGTQTLPEKDMFEALQDNVSQTDLDMFYNHEPLIQNVPKSTVGLMTLPYVEDTSVQEYPFSSSNGISDSMLIEKTFHDKFSSIETQTEQGHSQSFFDSDALSRTFALSSTIETQTTANLDNMEQLLYSNNYTQTSNKIISPDLVLTHIQTQTAQTQLDDTTVCAETQTRTFLCDTGCNISMGGCRSWLNTQTNHTETQTDLLSIFEELQ